MSHNFDFNNQPVVVKEMFYRHLKQKCPVDCSFQTCNLWFNEEIV